MVDAFIGEIRLFAGNYEPQNWRFCDGRVMQVSQNQELFALLGTIYGGDGVNTFKLPDLRDKVALGATDIQGNTAAGVTVALGQAIGQGTVALDVTNLPIHTHSVNIADGTHGPSPTAAGNQLAALSNNYVAFAPASKVTGQFSFNSGVIKGQLDGGSNPHNNTMPTIAVSCIICVAGLFPTRP